jgi:CheY-like chemotaxis protein
MAMTSRILISDDDTVVLRTISTLLQCEGYACDTAEDGAAALALLEEHDYDLLITDLHMPGNENLELLQSIPARQSNLPIIVLTGFPSWQTAVLAFRMTIYAYLQKPFSAAELLEHVDSAVRRHRIYSTVCSTRDSVAEWLSDMDNLRTLLEIPHLDNSGIAVKTFVAGALKNVFGAVSSISRLVEALPVAGALADESGVPKSPRTVCLEEGLTDAVRVLEATKRSFKSKEIAELRRRLETLLETEI